MSMCSLLLYCWKRVFAMNSAFSWQNSVSLCPASFVLWGQTCLLLQVSLYFLLLHSNPLWWIGHIFLVLVLGGLLFFTELINFSFFSICGWSIDLYYCDVELFTLETKQDHSVVFEVAPKYCILDSCWLWGILHFFSGILGHSSRYNGHLS